MGSKRKFWYCQDETAVDWLFKFPRENSGEHWAEKISAEVAAILGIMHARVELATYCNQRGSISESFTRGERELTHGNQILAGAMPSYDAGVMRRQKLLSLRNIWLALEEKCEIQIATDMSKSQFAEYLMLDALIGNVDRHHENWGIYEVLMNSDRTINLLAPTFDHASSLGRELSDEVRDRLMAEDRVGAYVERGRGKIYLSGTELHPPGPLELVRQALQLYPTEFRTAKLRLEQANEDSLFEIIAKVPPGWMSPSAREFAAVMMRYTVNELRKAFR